MKREIKFRGLRTDGKGWVYGLLRKQRQRDLSQSGPGVAYIGEWEYWIDSHELNQGSWLVIPESVGQFTGQGDVYEHEIVKDYKGDIYHVVYDEFDCSFKLRSSMIYGGARSINSKLEVIGNIHENEFPEPKPKNEKTSKTPSSESSQRRSTREALRGIGL